MKRTVMGLLAALFLLSACGTGNQNATGAPTVDVSKRVINVVTTTGMITDIVQNIGGNRVRVTGLMGPGVDPHLYKASEGNVRALEEADVIFYNGLHLEAQMASLFERMAERKKTVAVTDGIDRNLLLSSPQFAGAHDPHVWFDVSLWINAAERVRDSLATFDPQNAEQYQTNAKNYLKTLSEIDAYIKTQAATLPATRRVLITAHDAFNYFGRAYGFEVRGLQGISTESEASTANVEELAKFIAANKIPAIFVESSVPQRNIEAVQAAVRAQGFDVKIGGQLYSDAMGSPGTPEGTYVGMVKHNIDTIVSALKTQ